MTPQHVQDRAEGGLAVIISGAGGLHAGDHAKDLISRFLQHAVLK